MTSAFVREDRAYLGKTRPVLRFGDAGPAVIVLHEVYGMTRILARFCGWLADAGFRVHAPILLGAPDTSNPERATGGRTLALCVGREFTLFAGGKSSPVVDWLRPLARDLHGECGGRGVGVVGMCLTGGFGLSMAVEPCVVAPVLSQPSLPVLPVAALGISDADLATVQGRVLDEGLELRGYRFAGDTLCRQARFDQLSAALGAGFRGEVIPDEAGNPAGFRAHGKPPHSVLTRDLIDAAGEPTRAAVDEIVTFLRDRLI